MLNRLDWTVPIKKKLILPITFTVDEFLDFWEVYALFPQDYLNKCEDNSDEWHRTLLGCCGLYESDSINRRIPRPSAMMLRL